MRRDLVEEMEIARHAAEAELQLRESRYEAALTQLQTVESRLAELAEKRAEYSNRISALESSRASVDRLRQRLAASQASQAAAEESSVLTPVDQPETGPTPAGPSRAMIVLAGLFGGLVIGVGLVVCQLPTSDDQSISQQVPANDATEDMSDPSKPEWWEIPSAAPVEPAPAVPLTSQRDSAEPVDLETLGTQPDNVAYQDAHVDVAAAVATPVEVTPEDAKELETSKQDVSVSAANPNSEPAMDLPAEVVSDETAIENTHVDLNENELTVDETALPSSETPQEDVSSDSQPVDEAPSDAEVEKEAEQLQREADALEQEAEQREATSAPTVSPSAPTRTTMPTISFDDESLQEAMRQAFTS